MTKTCNVDGCLDLAARYSPLCSKHKRNKERWGHPLQKPMKWREIEDAAILCDRNIAVNRSADLIWAGLRESLAKIEQDAHAALKQHDSKLVDLEAARAARSVLEMLADTVADELILHMVGIGYLAAKDTQRFIDKKCLFATAARRCRALSRSQFKEFAQPVAKKRRLVMTDIKPTAALRLGKELISAFGFLGELIQEKEAEALKRRQESKQASVIAFKKQAQS